MAMDLPVGADVAEEAAAFGLRQTHPQVTQVGSERVRDAAPVVAIRLCPRRTSSRISRIRPAVVGGSAPSPMWSRYSWDMSAPPDGSKAAGRAWQQGCDRAAMAVRFERDEQVGRRQSRAHAPSTGAS